MYYEYFLNLYCPYNDSLLSAKTSYYVSIEFSVVHQKLKMLWTVINELPICLKWQRIGMLLVMLSARLPIFTSKRAADMMLRQVMWMHPIASESQIPTVCQYIFMLLFG